MSAMRCLQCDYDLSGLTEHRCPECGRAFDPDIPNTYWSQGVETARCRHTLQIAFTCALYAPIVLAFWSAATLLPYSVIDIFFRYELILVFAGVFLAVVPIAQIVCIGQLISVLLAPKWCRRELRSMIFVTSAKVVGCWAVSFILLIVTLAFMND